MSPGYIYLTIAIIAEVIATSALKAGEEFTKLTPSIIVALGYSVAFYMLSTLPQRYTGRHCLCRVVRAWHRPDHPHRMVSLWPKAGCSRPDWSWAHHCGCRNHPALLECQRALTR